MTTYFIGDLLTGRRIQTLNALEGPWTDLLNAAGSVSCTVSLKDPRMRRLNLRESAIAGKAFLAAFDGDTGLQGGPIWLHDWDDDTSLLTLTAAGMWSYFDHRALLPVLAGRLPSDPTTDTRFMPIDADPDSEYPWPTDTRKSLQGIARALVAQAQAETNGNVPIVLPAEIPGTATRAYRGSDVARVGERLSQLTQVMGGPDIRFPLRFTEDRMGVEWLMLIGTPTQPLLYSSLEPVFNVGVARSSVSKLKARIDGSGLGSRAFSTGGAAGDEALAAVSSDSTLTAAGWPILDLMDSPRSTVSELSTLQEYADELVLRGRRPKTTLSFTHNLARKPSLSSFSVGDFARVRVRENLYLADREYRMRITSRSGNVDGKEVPLTFAPAAS